MRILAIETSCDETALAVLDVTGNAKPVFSVEAHKIASQIALHTQYGGVFPMMAKREHSRNIVPLFLETLKEAKLLSTVKKIDFKLEKKLRVALEREPEMLELFLQEIPKLKKPKIDRIAVTVGPGLTPALWVGINFAKALSLVWDIPLVPVNHMEGHILSILVPKGGKEFQLTKDSFAFPAISLLVSGGHTEIVLVKSIGKYKILGATLDDAAGEAFDKVARMMGLPYPGGPEISRLAAMARKNKLVQTIKLPRPMLHTKDLNFSFSGLKTSVLYLIRDMGGIETLSDETKMNIAREFEDATCDVLVHKTLAAAKANKAKSIIVGGGVSANKELNERLTRAASAIGISVTFPTKDLSTDNAIMIGLAGYFGKKVSIKSKKLIAVGNMVL
jgi:N6-L-threonylcarbamoyladenine synthase